MDDSETSGEPPEPDPPESLTLEILDPEHRLEGQARPWLDACARRALERAGAAGEVRVRVVGDAEMARAHERYKGTPGTTDVLTFDLREGQMGPLDVDLLVCADEALRRGAQLGHAAERELLLYIVHGVLHCLGYGDEEEAGARRMHEREDQILSEIGVGVTYAAGEGGRA